jgi:hypothetical protein
MMTNPMESEQTVSAEIQVNKMAEQVNINVNPQPYDPSKKLTCEELFALPKEQRFQYYDAHGGVFAVAEETGHALSQDSADAILDYLRNRR